MGILEADFLEGKPTITRGEFTSIAVKFYGRSPEPEYGLSVSEQYFADVDNTTTLYANIINTAAFLGIVEGYEKRPAFPLTDLPDFKPNQAITVAEAITMLLRPLGYDTYADCNGGFPDGYLSAAAKYSLLPGVQADAILTREQAVELLWESLPVYCLITVSRIDQPNYVVADGTGKANLEWQSISGFSPVFMTAETSRQRNLHQETHTDNLFGDGSPWFLLDNANRIVLSCEDFQQIQAQESEESYIVTLSLPEKLKLTLSGDQDMKFIKDLQLCYHGSLIEIYDEQHDICSISIARQTK